MKISSRIPIQFLHGEKLISTNLNHSFAISCKMIEIEEEVITDGKKKKSKVSQPAFTLYFYSHVPGNFEIVTSTKTHQIEVLA
jgi:hypothetical protein